MPPDITQHSRYPCLPQWGNVNITPNTLPDFTYHNADEKRREIARGDMVTNGDIGYLNAEGYLYLNERKRDMVISGGVNSYPAEIEAALHNMPGVHDCVVFGIPDDEFGEALAAAVQPSVGVNLEADAVQSYLREHRQDFQAPPARALLGKSRPQDLAPAPPAGVGGA
jgi:long-chain acyl-CoA synthetase